MDTVATSHPLRVYKIWLPNHTLQCVYHAIYKLTVKSDYRKRLKFKSVSIPLFGGGMKAVTQNSESDNFKLESKLNFY